MNNCVYRFIDEGENIIYIGKAKNLNTRLSNHNHLPKECYLEQAYIDYACFDNEHEMDFAERYYIQTLNPKYNKNLSEKIISFTSTELDSKEFKVYKVNDTVIEHCKKQMEEIRKELKDKPTFVIYHSLYDVISFAIFKYNKLYKEFGKDQSDIIRTKVYDKIKFDYMFINVNNDIINIKNKLQQKYSMLEIRMGLYKLDKMVENCIDYSKNTIEFVIEVREKYTNTKVILPILIQCTQ